MGAFVLELNTIYSKSISENKLMSEFPQTLPTIPVAQEPQAAPNPVAEAVAVANAPVWTTFKFKRHPALREGIELLNFQNYAIYRAIIAGQFVFGLATGTGKTVCSYGAYFYYKMKFPNCKLLIVTTKSAVLQFNEEREKFFDLPEYQSRAVGPRMKKMYKMSGKTYADCRKQVYEQFAQPSGSFGSIDCLVMNYSVFRSDWSNLVKYLTKLKKAGIHLFSILDEATKFKNMGTETYRCVHALSKYSDRMVAATATMTKGKLEEVYAIFKAIGISLYATKEQFMDMHCITFVPPGGNAWQAKVVGYKNTTQFVELIKPASIVLTKKDVAPYLPTFTQTKSWVEHSEEQFNLLRDIYSGYINFKQFKAALEDDDTNPLAYIDKAEENKSNDESVVGEDYKMIDRLTEIGFVKRVLMDVRTVTQQNLNDYKQMSPKTEAVIEALCDEYTDEKIVIYSQSKRYLNLLANTIRTNPDVPEFYKKVLEIHGGVSDYDRNENKKKFSDSKDHNILILNDAGLEALNLQASGTLLVMTLPRSAGDLVQLAGRISRIGSTQSSLSIRYFMTEDSQDIDDYAALQSQLLVMYFANNSQESEEGLIDFEFLQKMYGVRGRGGLKESIEKDEMIKKAGVQLILASREKRSHFYAR